MIATKVAVDQSAFLADWARQVTNSGLRDMIALIMRPDVLSLASGLPASELFPMEALAEAGARVFKNRGLLQYRPAVKRLQEHIAELMAGQGVGVSADSIVITSGAQQGLDMLARLLINPGGQVILEEAIYTGARQVMSPLRAEILTVPTDVSTGMDVDAVEDHLRSGARPGFIYTISRGHNPTGVTMSSAKRSRLVELAREYGVPIVEDDAYGFIGYEPSGGQDRPVRAIGSDLVFYLGTFSKILVPALRLGWMVAPPALIPKLRVMKETCDLETSAFMQNLVTNFLDENDLSAHIARLQSVYRERRDAMLRALERYFLPSARWSVPTHGFFFWVELSPQVDPMRLLEAALDKERVAFVPGGVFAAVDGRAGRNCIRLNFSQASCSDIEEGVRRIAKLI